MPWKLIEMAVGTSHSTWIWLSKVEKILLRLWNYCACHAKAAVTFAPERGSHSPLNPLHRTSFRGKCDPTWFRGKCDPRAKAMADILSEPYLITQDIALPGFKIGNYFHPKRLANSTTQQERILQLQPAAQTTKVVACCIKQSSQQSQAIIKVYTLVI